MGKRSSTTKPKKIKKQKRLDNNNVFSLSLFLLAKITFDARRKSAAHCATRAPSDATSALRMRRSAVDGCTFRGVSIDVV